MAQRKRTRTAAQKRNDEKLRSRAKAGTLFKKRKSSHKAPKRRKTIKRTKAVKHVAKKRSVSHKKKGILGNIPLINNPTFKKAAAGVGTATIGAAALSLVAPQIANNPLVRPVLALAGGDIVGLAAQLFTQGGLKGIGLGGSSSSSISTNGNGFA